MLQTMEFNHLHAELTYKTLHANYAFPRTKANRGYLL